MTRVNQHRTNPSTAISNFKGRWDTVFAWPSTAISTWLNGIGGAIGNATRASGGTETVYTGFKSYKFTSNGSFVTDKGGYADVLVVGGGGAGGAGQYSRFPGGGGAGGVRLEEQVILEASTTYQCTVGAAGTPGSGTTGGAGVSSHFYISGSNLYFVGGGGGGDSSGVGGATSADHSDGTASPGTGAGGGGAALHPVHGLGSAGWAGGAAGTYGGQGATGNISGSYGTSGHGGGKVGHSPSTGTSAMSPGTIIGTLNDYETGSDLPYACGGGGLRFDGSNWDQGYPHGDFDLNSGASGRISGGYGSQGLNDQKSANQNTGGGGGGIYGATSGSGAAGVIIIRVAT